MDALLTIFWGLVVLIVLVVVHELGHFVAARIFGVRVTEFMIGLPGPNIGFEHNGTRYGVTCIPLGGYNRITGMEGGPEDPNLEAVLAHVYRQGSTDAEHVACACGISVEDADFALTVLDEWGSINKPGRSNKTDKYCAPKTAEYALGQAREVEDPKALLDSERQQTYRGLPFWKRLIVLFAGPLMNVVLAVILFLVMLCVVGVSYGTTTIDTVIEDEPAYEAGLQSGDTITEINGVEVETLSALSSALSEVGVGETVDVTYERDGKTYSVQVVTTESDDGRPVIGFYAATAQMRYSPIEALQISWEMTVLTVQSYASLFNPATAATTLSQSSSVVGISVMAKQAAETGIFNMLYLIAVISLSLAVVNLLPLPPLDGGRIVVEIIQKIIGRDVSVRVINTITIVVMALLILLFIYMVRQDVLTYIIGGATIFE